MSHIPFFMQRRMFSVLCSLSPLALAGCVSHPTQRSIPATPLSEEDLALQCKFRGLRGGQLRVDSLFDVAGLNIFDEHGRIFFKHANLVPPRGLFNGSYGADFGVPKFLRAEWRARESTFRAEGPNGSFSGGTVIANHTIPVASLIPDALLEEKRRNGGGFRLKIRIHPDGPLIGWDLERGMASAPDGSRFHFAGGDFQEAFIENGKVLRKGWFIHPRTHQRIETDF